MEDLVFDFNLVQHDFDNLITHTKEKLKTEWTYKYPNEIVNGGQFTILSLYNMAIVNYGSVIALCKISEEENFNLYLSTPSLNRAIMENLFSLTYLLSNFIENNKIFIKNCVREKREELEFHLEHFNDNPKWSEYLDKQSLAFKLFEDSIDKIVNFTNDEKKNMKNMQRFPRVSGIVKYLDKKSHPDIKFFKYLENYHYVSLSQISHSQSSGLIETGNLLEKPNKARAIKFMNDQRWIAVTLIMCLMSEIESNFSYNLKSKLVNIWEILINYSEYAQETYKLRYRNLLSNS